MHFVGTGSKAGTLLTVNKPFNIHLLTVNEFYMLSRSIKCETKNKLTVNTMLWGWSTITHFKTALLKNIFGFPISVACFDTPSPVTFDKVDLLTDST